MAMDNASNRIVRFPQPLWDDIEKASGLQHKSKSQWIRDACVTELRRQQGSKTDAVLKLLQDFKDMDTEDLFKRLNNEDKNG